MRQQIQMPSFRSITGAQDAPALIAVHSACRETDRVLDDSVLEYKPTLDWYTQELTNSDPQDWIVVEAGEENDPGREVVGYGHTLWDWAERDGNHCYLHNGWIKPGWRGQGIGRELLMRLETRCREKAVRDGTESKAEYGANATGTEGAAQRLLARSGYHALYTLVEMELPPGHTLPGEADAAIPDGYDLRSTLPEHHRAIWQCIGDSYYIYGGDNRGREIADEDSYQRYFQSGSADPTLWFVAWEGSRIAGQCLCRVENGVGEVYEVSVGHPHRRKGLAKALLVRSVQELRRRSVARIRLFTKRENPTQAWRLYEAVGFQTLKTFPRWRKPLP